MPADPLGSPVKDFRLDTSTWNDATVVKCFGSLTMEHCAVLAADVKKMIPHSKRIVLDLNEVTRMDSSGLGAIVGLYISARKVKCELLLINYNKSVRQLLGLTNLLSVFESCGQIGRIP